MRREAQDLWQRAREALCASETVVPVSADAAASRAYYATFYAVSALFALRGRTFSRHSAVEAAVHRDLVREGVWHKELGATYTELMRLREVGDYGGDRHVSPEQARDATERARRILEAVKEFDPDQFHGPVAQR
ncbi:MAG: HEPN domain-containing protein [Planctomycetota bacterium]